MNSLFRAVPLAAVAILMCACNGVQHGTSMETPNADQMRAALKDLFLQRPELSMPEFDVALAESAAVTQGSLIRIGVFDCDPNVRSFEAVFSAPNLTMYDLKGRFELDARNVWRAIPVRAKTTNARDLTRREDWFPTDVFSWSKERY